MLRAIWKAIWNNAKKDFDVTQLAEPKRDPRVVPMKDAVVKCFYYNHPSRGDVTAMMRKSKIKYGG